MTPLDRGPETARFMAATYTSDVRFSYLPGFARQVRDEISKRASSADDLIDILSDATDTAGEERPLTTEHDVQRHQVDLVCRGELTGQVTRGVGHDGYGHGGAAYRTELA